MMVKKTRAALKKEWPATIREDGCRMEIICPHGVGHPVKLMSKNWSNWMGVHGCDGCCSLAVFAIAEMAHKGEIE